MKNQNSFNAFFEIKSPHFAVGFYADSAQYIALFPLPTHRSASSKISLSIGGCSSFIDKLIIFRYATYTKSKTSCCGTHVPAPTLSVHNPLRWVAVRMRLLNKWRQRHGFHLQIHSYYDLKHQHVAINSCICLTHLHHIDSIRILCTCCNIRYLSFRTCCTHGKPVLSRFDVEPWPKTTLLFAAVVTLLPSTQGIIATHIVVITNCSRVSTCNIVIYSLSIAYPIHSWLFLLQSLPRPS